MAEKGRYIYAWPRPMVTVDALVFCFLEGAWKALLIKRGQEPAKDHWAIPGGFLELAEELADGAARELSEETGITGVHLTQLHTFGTLGRDPRGRLLTVVYTGTIPSDQATARAGDDAAEAHWFPLDQLPEKMAFDHRDILQLALTVHPPQ